MGFYEEIVATVRVARQEDKKRVKREALLVLLCFLGFTAAVILMYTY